MTKGSLWTSRCGCTSLVWQRLVDPAADHNFVGIDWAGCLSCRTEEMNNPVCAPTRHLFCCAGGEADGSGGPDFVACQFSSLGSLNKPWLEVIWRLRVCVRVCACVVCVFVCARLCPCVSVCVCRAVVCVPCRVCVWCACAVHGAVRVRACVWP